MEYGSAQAYLRGELKQAGSVEVLEKHEMRFEGLPAVSVRYRKSAGGAEVETEEIIAFRIHPKNLSSIFYVIWLSTPTPHYEEDHKLFEQVRAGFHLLLGPRASVRTTDRTLCPSGSLCLIVNPK